MFAWASSYNIFIKAIWEKLPDTFSENRENLNGDLPNFALKDDKLP